MTFSFHPEAKDEFNEAVEYYENCEPGLGCDFSIEALAAVQNIVNYPTAWPIIEEDVRRCLINRFPYGIIYLNSRILVPTTDTHECASIVENNPSFHNLCSTRCSGDNPHHTTDSQNVISVGENT